MPRRKQQFSFLRRAIKANSTGTLGGKLLEFNKFQTGDPANKRKSGTIPEGARKRIAYATIPFGVTLEKAVAPGDYHRIAVTSYSQAKTNGADVGLSQAELGWEKVKATDAKNPDYYPAIIRYRMVPDKAQIDERTSGITKEKYKVRAGAASYSVPFGRTTDKALTDSYLFRRNKLTDDLSAKKVTSVTYVPEQWNSPMADPEAGK